MKVRHLLVGLSTLISGLFVVAPASATTYSHDATVQFTFNSEISVVIDTADIEILDLAPGTSSDSNVVGITISTNNVVGYTASATVGNATYNTTSMTHTNGTNAFTSIAENASEASLSTDNTWGYTTSLDNGSSWANLSGLPIYTETAKEIAATNSPASDAIKFKINAKASTSQPAGDYTNKINFIVVANVPPRTIGDVLDENPNTPRDPVTGLPTIQSVNEDVCDATEAIGESTILTDVRDHKNYRVAKLKDGRCWLQDNLSLDLTDNTVLANTIATNTNASATSLNYLKNGGGDISDRYATSSVIEYPTPGPSESDACTIPMISTEIKDKTSLDYWHNESITEIETSKFGIHYNACAASAGSYCYKNEYDLPVDNPNTAIDMDEDICPAGWRIPTGLSQSDSMPDGGEFITLRTATGGPHTDYRKALLSSLSGYYDFISGTMGVDSYSYFWTSTKRDYYRMYIVEVATDNFYPVFNDPRSYGFSVRCILKKAPRLSIVFNSNSGDGTTYTQEIRYGKTDRLINNTFTRSGYAFNGWNTKADGTGAGYGDQDNYTATTDTSITSITLYAQWISESSQNSGNAGKTLQDAYEQAYVRNEDQSGHYYDTNAGRYKKGLYVPHKTNGVYDGTYFEATVESDYAGIPAKDLRFAIQDIDMTIDGVKVCDYATVIGSEAYVLDLRDNKSYWIAKLADGKCWMTQNLDLNLETTPNNVAALTSLNTDLNTYGSNGYDSNNGYSQTNNIITWAPERSTIAPSSISNSGSISGYANDDNNPYSVDPGDWYWTDSWYASTINIYLDIAGGGAGDKFKQTPYTGNGEHGHVGNYYNWSAAVASNNASSYASSTYDDITNNPQNSICPKGWRLPIITSYTTGQQGSNDFYNLANKYGNVNSTDSFITASPVYFVRSGNISSNSQYTSGYGGRYWTSTVMRGGSSTYHLYFHSGSIYFTGGTSRGLGFSVRCVAR